MVRLGAARLAWQGKARPGKERLGTAGMDAKF
nr:MAG TPA: hypothetical protein [Caudoviricetes sp.]